jgi:hypothetical protein
LKSSVHKTAITCSARDQVPCHNTCSSQGADLITSLSQAFNPEAQKFCDAERASRSLQNTQYLALIQQLQDLQWVNEQLHLQLSDVQGCLQDADRSRDCAELKLEMLQMLGLGNTS